MKKIKKQSGLSMIEILIVTAILGLLVILAITMLPQQISKGRDGRRKSDLQKIKIAFEDYYNDNDCYPPPEILDNCGSADLSPYMASIPCDPQTKTKYLYAPEETACPHYYRVFSNLEINIDPVVQQLGCDSADGCGAFAFFGNEIGPSALEYNYGVSEGVPVYVGSGSGGGTIPPTSGYCCSLGGSCNYWEQGQGVCSGQLYQDSATCVSFCGSGQQP